jgi:hypothetical protein
MKSLPKPAPNADIRKRRISAIVLTLALAAIVAAAFANNAIGALGLLAAPFWLPVCCYFVPLVVVKFYLGVSILGVLVFGPLIVVNDALALPKGFAFFFWLGSLMMSVGSGLGLLVAYSREKQGRPKGRNANSVRFKPSVIEPSEENFSTDK